MTSCEVNEQSHLVDLYQRCGPTIYRRALAMLGDPDEALDVTQDTFLAYMRGHSLLRGEASPLTVLISIATYKGVDRLRRRMRWGCDIKAPEAGGDEEAQCLWEAATAHAGGMGQVEALHDLKVLTRRESPRVLSLLRLYLVEGRTFDEAGEALSLSRRTVARLLRGFIERACGRAPRFIGI